MPCLKPIDFCIAVKYIEPNRIINYGKERIASEMQLIGKGNTAEVYALNDSRVLKLFFDGIPRELVMGEYRKVVSIQEWVKHTPAAYSFVDRGSRFGIVYERYHGEDMINVMLHEPVQTDALSKVLAHTHAALHKHMASAGKVPSVKSKLDEDIRYADGLSVQQKDCLTTYLSTLPEGHSICHFDFHPGNIVLENGDPVIIDWMTACIGDPCADVARTCLLLNYGEMLNASPQEQAFIKSVQTNILDVYLREYLSCSGIKREDIEKWVLPVAAARLREWITDHERSVLQSIIRNRLMQL